MRNTQQALTSQMMVTLQANSSNTTIVSWYNIPDQRGTWNLLYSCIFTLALCVSTALHLNVPPRGTGKLKSIARKTRWIILGLLAPEIVLWVAFDQWRRARAVRDAVNSFTVHSSESISTSSGKGKGLATNNETEEDIEMQNMPQGSRTLKSDCAGGAPDKPGRKWEIIEGFFADMGGFAFDASSMSSSHKRLTITPAGVEFLAKYGQVPTVSRESIEDKAKADLLAKGLVVLQTSWLLLQCLGRKVQSLSISLLEVHTVVHVVCALAIYFFWLKKPRDVQDLALLTDADQQELLAYMMMVSPGLRLINHTHSREAESSILIYEPEVIEKGKSRMNLNDQTSYEIEPSSSILTTHQSARKSTIVEGIVDVEERLALERGSPKWVSVDPAYVDSSTGFGFRQQLKIGTANDFFNNLFREPTYDSKTVWQICPEDLSRWRLARRAIHRHPDLSPAANFGNTLTKLGLSSWTASSDESKLVKESPILVERFRPDADIRISWKKGAPRLHFQPLLIVFFVMYGAVHLVAYEFVFPTPIESALWYFSSLYIMSTSWVILAIHGQPLIVSIALFGVPYAFSRLFLIVEALISLRAAEIGIYHAVQWAEWIPHL